MNWREIIRDGLRTGRRSTFEERMASRYWLSCACGKLDKRIPRARDGEMPEDGRLQEYGEQFNIAIVNSHWRRADELLDLIEVREGELLGPVDIYTDPDGELDFGENKFE